MAVGPGGAGFALYPQGPDPCWQLCRQPALFPWAGVWKICPLWRGGGSQRSTGRYVGRGAGRVFGVSHALSGVYSHTLRGSAAGCSCHPLGPVRAEGRNRPPTVRPGCDPAALAPHRDDNGAFKRFSLLHSRAVCSRVLFRSGMCLLFAADKQPSFRAYGGRPGTFQRPL